jgi:hypothetical protein
VKGSILPSYYLEIGAIRRLSDDLSNLDQSGRDYKLFTCIAISSFILNIIKYRKIENISPTFGLTLQSKRYIRDIHSRHFYCFRFFKPDGVTERLDSPTHYQVLNWARNRITHLIDDSDKNADPPWPRGLDLRQRGPDGIREFSICGPTSFEGSPVIAAVTDRRRFTAFVQYFVSLYFDALNTDKIDISPEKAAKALESAESNS